MRLSSRVKSAQSPEAWPTGRHCLFLGGHPMPLDGFGQGSRGRDSVQKNVLCPRIVEVGALSPCQCTRRVHFNVDFEINNLLKQRFAVSPRPAAEQGRVWASERFTMCFWGLLGSVKEKFRPKGHLDGLEEPLTGQEISGICLRLAHFGIPVESRLIQLDRGLRTCISNTLPGEAILLVCPLPFGWQGSGEPQV